MSRLEGHAPAGNAAALREELDRYRRLFTGVVPNVCSHVVGLAKLAVRDPETGEVRSSDHVELWTIYPTGPQLTYLTAQDAENLSQLLDTYARQARTGLIAVSGADAQIRG